jgi:hypothetical protein
MNFIKAEHRHAMTGPQAGLIVNSSMISGCLPFLLLSSIISVHQCPSVANPAFHLWLSICGDSSVANPAFHLRRFICGHPSVAWK